MNQHQNEGHQEISQLTYDEIAELLPGFVLGALETEEMFAVDAYLQNHQELMMRLQELETATVQLIYATPPLTPPPNVKANLMARAEAELAIQSAQQPLVEQNVYPQRKIYLRKTPTTQEQSKHDRPSFFQSLFASTTLQFSFGVGALIICLLSIATAISLFMVNQLATQRDEIQSQVVQLQDANITLQEVNQSLEQQLQDQQRQIKTFVSAKQVITLAGTEDAPQASGLLYLASNETVLALHNLERLPTSESYQLWLIPETGSPTSAGLIDVLGPETILTLSPTALQENPFINIGLSIEPAGGSDVPTGKIVLLR